MADSSNPYQSPNESGEAFDASRSSIRHVKPFESSRGRAKWTVSLLAIGMVTNVVSIWSNSLELDFFHKLEMGAFEGLSELEINEIATASDTRQLAVGSLQLLLLVGTGIAFLMWFHRAHRNLGALGCTDLKYTPGWAVGGFFVPILNLVRPYQVAAEIWQGSDPDGLDQKTSTSGIVVIWWALWILNNVLGQIGFRISNVAEEIADLAWATKFSIANDIVTVVAALPAICMVLAISKNQNARFDRLNGSTKETESGERFFIE